MFKRNKPKKVSAKRKKDLEAWCEEMLAKITDARSKLEDHLGQLSYYVERWDNACSQMDREKAICQNTRMVVVFGELLDCVTKIFMQWSGQPVPEDVWDIDLAARTDGLLERAVEVVEMSPYCNNCSERFEYARQSWERWCPEFAEAKATGASSGAVAQ
jgi:hypothetical protein